MNTLGHYKGEKTVYLTSKKIGNLNPYEASSIGTTVTFVGKRCGAEDCDAIKAKHVVAVNCDKCGATEESCLCAQKQKIDSREGNSLNSVTAVAVLLIAQGNVK